MSIWNSETLDLVRNLEVAEASPGFEVAWRHRDNRIFTRRGRRLMQWNPDSGELLSEIELPGSGQTSLDPTSDRVALLSPKFGYFLLDTETGTTIWKSGMPHVPNSLAFGPQGRRIANGMFTGGLILLHAGNGQEVYADARDRAGAARGSGVAWHPSGKTVAVGSGTIRVYDALRGGFLVGLEGHRDLIHDLDFNSSGSRLASVGADNEVLIWDGATGELLVRIPLEESSDLWRVAWSPNGKRIAVLAKDGTLWTLGTPAADRPIYQPDFLENGILRSVKGVDAQLAELNRQVEHNPNDVQWLRKRGEWYASQLRWREALEDFERITELRPNFMWERTYAARAGLMTGETDVYQRHIDVARDVALEKKRAMAGVAADFIAKTVALSPGAHPQLEQLLQLSKAHAEKKGSAIWASHGVILLPLRLGRATEVLQLVERYKGETRPNHRIFLDAVKALAHHQLEEPIAAKQSLEAATARATTAWFEPAEDEPIPYADLVDYVEAKVLLEEATGAIRGNPNGVGISSAE